MAGSMKEIKLRIKSVESTMQITKAMELVASSKLRRAKERVEHSRPYFETLYATLFDIAAADSEFSSPYLAKRETHRRLYIVIAGDRGLAGGYNANLFREAERRIGDRPAVVPEGAVNFAFIGQFAETKRDTIFTTEYSMRTGMEAVYTLLNVDRGVPEVWGSVYDVRDLLNATVKLRDGKKATDMDMGFMEKMAVKKALGKIEGTDIEKLLKEYGVI